MNVTRLSKSISHRRMQAARIASALGGSFSGRLRLFIQVFSLPRNGTVLRRLRCCYERTRFTLHCFSFRELAPFSEVFSSRDYEGDWTNCRTILDAGANIGAAS